MIQKIDYPLLVASFVASLGLWFLVDHDCGAYVGFWVPGILILWVGVQQASDMAKQLAAQSHESPPVECCITKTYEQHRRLDGVMNCVSPGLTLTPLTAGLTRIES